MGNQQSNEYSLDKFISELNIREIHNVHDSEIKFKLESICDLFRTNKEYYSNYKRTEENISGGSNDVRNDNNGDDLTSLQPEEEVSYDELKKTKKFCILITFMIKLNFHKEFHDNYLMIIEMMGYLLKEREFFKYFMINSAEHLCNMVTMNSIYSSKFYKDTTQLFINLLDIANKDPRLISGNISGLRKIMIVPKKLIDPTYCKDSEVKFNLLRLMRLNMLLMRDLNETANRDRTFVKNKEYLDFVNNSITEYHNTSVFTKLSEDLIKKDCDTETHKIIVESFDYLSQIEFVIGDGFIRCEKEVRNMLSILERSEDDELVQQGLKFLINFHITSFNLECLNNFKLFLYEDCDLEEKLFTLFRKQDRSDDVKFLICCLFLCVSIVEEIWNKLKALNMIKPTVRFMLGYIAKTFNADTNHETQNCNLKRLGKIKTLIKIFSFISDEKNYKKVFHIDYFKIYFDIVLVLFYVYHNSYRVEILTTMNVFTYFYDCKSKIQEEKNKNIILVIHKRTEELFANLKRLYGIYNESHENKNKLVSKKANISLVEYKNKFQENISLLEDLCLNTKSVFFKTAQEFGLLMSILVNSMLNQDFSGNILKVCPDKNFFKDRRSKNKDQNKDKDQDKEKENNKGTLVEYDEFFKGLDLFKSDLKNYNSPYEYINKYIRQIVIARMIQNPIGRVESDKKSEGEDNEDASEVTNLSTLYEMMKFYKSDGDILHKIIYAINRLLSFSRKPKLMMDTIKKIIDELKTILFSDYNTLIIVNRECLRLFCSMTTFSDNTLLWLKFDSKKVHVDYSNFSDLMLKYKDNSADWEPEDEEKERIIFPPYLKVKSYADKMGVIFYGDHVLVLPKRLSLGNNFTIWFRFFNPVISSPKWHVLLQDPTGIGALICIDPSKKRLGCFTEDGEFIDSGIDLDDPELKKKWIQVSMSFRARMDNDKSEQSRLDWYVNSQLRKSYNEKIILSRTIQYIGNSRDYSEPFGVFCDVRIYKNYLNSNQIGHIYHGEENGKKEKNEYDLLYYIYHKAIESIIANFLNSVDTSEETFYFSIKFFNNIMANRLHRSRFINYHLIMKICKYYSSRKIETKKEISKFLQTIA